MKLYDGSTDCCYVCGWDYTKAHGVEAKHSCGFPTGLNTLERWTAILTEAAMVFMEIQDNRLNQLKKQLNLQ